VRPGAFDRGAPATRAYCGANDLVVCRGGATPPGMCLASRGPSYPGPTRRDPLPAACPLSLTPTTYHLPLIPVTCHLLPTPAFNVPLASPNLISHHFKKRPLPYRATSSSRPVARRHAITLL
jgi:hypothetical protein